MQQPPKFMPDKELSKVGGSLWLYIIMQLTLSFLFSFVAMPLIMYSLYYDYSAINACIEMLISFISGIILLWFMSNSFKRSIQDLKFTFKPKETIDTVAMMYFLNYAIGIIGALLSKFGFPDTSPDFSLSGGFLYNLFTFISVVILAPIFEELIFRGMILQVLSKYNKVFAILVTSLLFGLLHLNMTQAVPAFFMSLILCYMCLKTDSLLVTILAHVGNNLLALMSVYSDNFVLITVVIMVFVIYGLITIILKSKEVNAFIKEEKTNENWYARFFKQIPNLLYLIFTILWIIISLFMNMF
ncbi:CPBP family intramembrane glutamic endopeptidase [Holdemanella biformis]|uniref:CPBP family intramembrane metalloprotease n=1 Tax=Holdemanella biformis TaxID=1735 RepID=A0A413UEQ8_9FIRM|nr:type II CAAX endopeptidase family protein [Holdemanella biformis]RHB08607.1 CPBP family intramembrane metalloprotease [Holdemanella biformis]